MRPMKRSRLLLLVGLSGFALGAAGCAGGGGNSGTGGSSGSAGANGAAGTTGGTSPSGSGGGGATGSGGTSAAGTNGAAGTTGSGGTTGSAGTVGSAGAAGTVGSGGTTGLAGASGTVGTAGRGGSAGGNTGTGGGAGSGAGSTGSGGSGPWTCPSGVTGNPLPSTTIAATRITGAPPADTFNNTGNNFTNVEGPVWIGDTLYFSEMQTTDLPPSRILAIGPGDAVSVFIADSGSNGLAVDPSGNIVSANHGMQGIVRFSLPGKTATTLVSMYNGKKFNCPNDLAIARDGTIYFTDPSYQNGSNPQMGTRVYQLAPGATTATAVTDYTQQPNGIALSLDESTLYVGGQSGLKKYAITGGTVAMTGTAFGPSDVTMSGVNVDGMTLDCAGNLYAAVASTTNVIVVKSDGTKLGTITISGAQAATNVAFGGTDHQTLYITGQGSGKNQGVFRTHLNIPGKPY
jgi:sugar lactone lactonase YvrE